jgi:predicted Zn-dependent protease
MEQREEAAPGVAPTASRFRSREAVLIAALALAGVLLGLTRAAAVYYRAKQAALAQWWFVQGDRALQAGRPTEAIGDLRNALAYEPENSTFQFRLAQALIGAGRLEEARSYLLQLWARAPGDGAINLELARLEARLGNPDAVRYFNNAIYGVWYGQGGGDPLERRWEARLELLQYWLQQGNLAQAQAVLLALGANVARDDYRRHTLVGELELKAQAPAAALDQFRQALRVRANYVPALTGAAEAEIALGDYRAAANYLETAARQAPRNAEIASRLRLVRLVLAHDPFALGLSDRERTERAAAAFGQAQRALQNCAARRGVVLAAPSPTDPLQQLWQRMEGMLSQVRRLRRNPQHIIDVMSVVGAAEDLMARQCGPLQNEDEALWLIAKRHQLLRAAPATVP